MRTNPHRAAKSAPTGIRATLTHPAASWAANAYQIEPPAHATAATREQPEGDHEDLEDDQHRGRAEQPERCEERRPVEFHAVPP